MFLAGESITAGRLNAINGQTYTKVGQDTRASQTSYQADSELQGIDMSAGRWAIECLFFVTGDVNGIGDVKIRWAFTGTWNNPIRACLGPQLGSTDVNNTAMRINGFAASADATYGLANSSNYTTIREETYSVQVDTPGLLSIEFAQITSATNVTIMRAGSTVKVRPLL